ncbi:MAG: carboxylesterase family protein, partial [Myxococcales bacterium]|nr:carboxylesterase family protein [Myxococcales bacterium]
ESSDTESSDTESSDTESSDTESSDTESSDTESSDTESSDTEPSDKDDDAPGADSSEDSDANAQTAPAVAGGAEADAATAKPEPKPEPEPSKGLAVIVKLHASGSENSGSANNRALHGGLLAKKGVVVVTLNRRLGPAGYMAGDELFEGDVLNGNRSPMDVIRALEWVRDNIARFGGDPGNVTLWGHSGGGTATWTILSSPKSEGLVHRAVLMSAPIYEWPKAEATKVAAAVLDTWGVKPGDADALAKVESDDASSTVMSTTVATSDEFGEMSRVAMPVAGTHGTEFLPDDTFAAIEKGRYNNIDILVGTCLDDHVVSTLYVPMPDSFALDIANSFIDGLIAEDDAGVEKMKEAYANAFPEDSTLGKARLQTDALYRIRALRAAASHSAKTQGPEQGRTYVYQFNWKSPMYPEKIGAFHGADMMFAFGNIAHFPRMLGEKDGQLAPTTQALSDGFSDAIVTFAKTGVPSSDKLPKWPEYDPDQRQTMVLDKESAVVSDPLGNLRKFWE